MANRDTTNGSTTPKPTGPDYLDEYSGHIGVLFNNSVLPLTSVSGADTITASVDPALPSGGLSTGMKFSITWAADNTGAATLNIGGTGAVSIVGKSGEALAAGQLAEDMRDILEYDGTNFILVTGGADTGESITGTTTYTYSDTWTNDYPDNTIVMVECWGAGGGGASAGGGGGGGGGYQRGFFRAGDLPSTVAITVPAGASANSNGGSCTFGAYLAAHGGKGGSGSNGGNGGGGGPSGAVVSGAFGGGDGGDSGNNGAEAAWGGGGGGGYSIGAGGGSEYGGAGGAASVAGSAPGGGGGGGVSPAAGARGECRVTVF
jgi:hypothetical protein